MCLDCVERPRERRGLCKCCVKRRLRAGLDLPPKLPQVARSPRLCSIDGCTERHVARGLCPPHWKAWRRSTAEAEMRNPDSSLQRRFWAKVEVGHPAGCWWWTGAKNKKGYAQATVGQHTSGAHRWAWKFLVGEIGVDPETGEPLELDHLCKNRLCVNPDHLEPITHHLNVWRSSRYAGHDACPNGHSRIEHVRFNVNGHQYCGACAVEWQRRNRSA